MFFESKKEFLFTTFVFFFCSFLNFAVHAKALLKTNEFILSNSGLFKTILQPDGNLCTYKNESGRQVFQWCIMMPLPQYGLPPAVFPGEFGLNERGDFGAFDFCPTDSSYHTISKILHFTNSESEHYTLILDDAGVLKLQNENQNVLWDSRTGSKLFDNSGYTPCDYFSPQNPKNITSTYPKPPSKYGSFYTKYESAEGVDILATPSVPDEKLNLVAVQYNVMLNALKNPRDKEFLQGVRVFLMSQYDNPSQMTFFYFPNQTQDYFNYLNLLNVDLRGSTFNGGDGAGSLLITDEMICTKGVTTRGPSDTAYRGLDQVVHEMGHKFDFALNLTSRPATIDGIYYTGLYDLIQKNGIGWGNSDGEFVAYSFQHFFEQCYACANSKDRSTTANDMHPKIRKYFETVVFNTIPQSRMVRCKNWE